MKKLLGDHLITIRFFDGLDALFQKWTKMDEPIDRKRSEIVNKALLELIQKEPEPCFLLPAVLQFVQRVDEEKILQHYTFVSFEIWLNQYSGLSFEENSHVRGKIAGKWIDRGAYQTLFPIGMGKFYEGTHFVTAHKSPDLDTTIASFWGWLDAFAARVGNGQHLWNLPEGPPPSQIEIDWIFRDLFGPAVLTHLPKTRSVLTLTGNDLMKQEGFQKKTLTDSIADIDHGRDQNAIVVVDEKGFYLGDWRAFDVEGVRQVIILLSSCLRWFENQSHLKLISLFSKETLNLSDVKPVLRHLVEVKIRFCEPAQEFSQKQKQHVDDFLKKVLGLAKGIDSDFEELANQLCGLSGVVFTGAEGLVQRMQKAKLFDAKGHLIDERPRIFAFLEQVVEALHLALVKIRSRLEKLDIALKTKFEVFGHHPTTVSVRSDVMEIVNKMAHYPYLTVVYPDKDQLYPVGIIQSDEIRKTMLGTVSLRDFCNRDEMGIPPFLEVISVIDHHKTTLNTFAPPMMLISDAQSSNTLVAQKAFEINDAHSLLGQEPKKLKSQIAHHAKEDSSESVRLLKRLLTKQLILQKKTPYYIHPEREYIEYLHFLYGIIDDTDLLSKVSVLDVECVASLLNRLKSLSLKEEVEIINLDDLVRDKNFAKKAAERILQNEDMYSLYARVYKYREKEVEKNLSLCAKGEVSNLFADTKEQNGCCRVGQTKLFAANLKHFEKLADDIRKTWLKKAMKVQSEKPEIDLHIHMISTIVNAEEVYKGTVGKYTHQDELWIWIPETDTAEEHLARFLNAFQKSSGLKNNPVTIELLGANANALEMIFKESFQESKLKRVKELLPIAVLKYKAGSLNSRKAMVSPFLPKLSS